MKLQEAVDAINESYVSSWSRDEVIKYLKREYSNGEIRTGDHDQITIAKAITDVPRWPRENAKQRAQKYYAKTNRQARLTPTRIETHLLSDTSNNDVNITAHAATGNHVDSNYPTDAKRLRVQRTLKSRGWNLDSIGGVTPLRKNQHFPSGKKFRDSLELLVDIANDVTGWYADMGREMTSSKSKIFHAASGRRVMLRVTGKKNVYELGEHMFARGRSKHFTLKVNVNQPHSIKSALSIFDFVYKSGILKGYGTNQNDAANVLADEARAYELKDAHNRRYKV